MAKPYNLIETLQLTQPCSTTYNQLALLKTEASFDEPNDTFFFDNALHAFTSWRASLIHFHGTRQEVRDVAGQSALTAECLEGISNLASNFTEALKVDDTVDQESYREDLHERIVTLLSLFPLARERYKSSQAQASSRADPSNNSTSDTQHESALPNVGRSPWPPTRTESAPPNPDLGAERDEYNIGQNAIVHMGDFYDHRGMASNPRCRPPPRSQPTRARKFTIDGNARVHDGETHGDQDTVHPMYRTNTGASQCNPGSRSSTTTDTPSTAPPVQNPAVNDFDFSNFPRGPLYSSPEPVEAQPVRSRRA